MNYPIPIVRVILEDEGKKVLFLRRASKIGKDKLCLPGGKVDYGKTLENAVKDEMKEETGLYIFNIRYWFYQDRLPKDKGTQYLTHYFSADYEGVLKLNRESFEAIWIKLAKLSDYKDEIAFGNYEGVLRFFEERMRKSSE